MSGLSLRISEVMLSDEERQLYSALKSSGPAKLKKLWLTDNQHWFGNIEARLHLISLMQSQTCLETLSLSGNLLSSSATEEVFRCLAASSCAATLKNISMVKSANLST